VKRILFVCLGNICRSPLGEGVFRHLAAEAGLADRLEVDSAGTSAYHVGEPPDERMRATARANGIDLSGQRARKFATRDFEGFDLIVAMDRDNHRTLLARCPEGRRERVRLMRSYDPEGPGDVPDPYYGGAGGFDEVYAIVERSCRGLVDELRRELG